MITPLLALLSAFVLGFIFGVGVFGWYIYRQTDDDYDGTDHMAW